MKINPKMQKCLSTKFNPRDLHIRLDLYIFIAYLWYHQFKFAKLVNTARFGSYLRVCSHPKATTEKISIVKRQIEKAEQVCYWTCKTIHTVVSFGFLLFAVNIPVVGGAFRNNSTLAQLSIVVQMYLGVSCGFSLLQVAKIHLVTNCLPL